MLNPEAIPLLDPTSRYLFEHASENKNTLLQTSVLIDAQIVDAQIRAHYDPAIELPDFHELIEDLTYQAQHSIKEADRTGEGTWTDYFRLVSQAAFLEQRLMVPFVFAQRRYYRERTHLVNGIYGVSAHIINDALHEHDSKSATVLDREQLRGVIQEQTKMALFHKPELSKQIALPAATCADLYHKTDVEIWILPDRQPSPIYIPTQIKSSTHCPEASVTPDGGITLFAHEFNNNHNMSISRLIAHDHRYMQGTADALTPKQQATLSEAREKLVYTIAKKTGLAL